eukprot:352544-Chlamydomonas_euryale.AAC.17
MHAQNARECMAPLAVPTSDVMVQSQSGALPDVNVGCRQPWRAHCVQHFCSADPRLCKKSLSFPVSRASHELRKRLCLCEHAAHHASGTPVRLNGNLPQAAAAAASSSTPLIPTSVRPYKQPRAARHANASARGQQGTQAGRPTSCARASTHGRRVALRRARGAARGRRMEARM